MTSRNSPLIFLTNAGYASYALPLPIALLSPLADHSEWRLWIGGDRNPDHDRHNRQ